MTDFDREMQKALTADGEKLRALTGKDHGPVFLDDEFRCCGCGAPVLPYNLKPCDCVTMTGFRRVGDHTEYVAFIIPAEIDHGCS